MSQWLKQSTAYTFRLGPFVDATDGFTPETGLSIGATDIKISKAGGALASKSSSTAPTHDSNGYYLCVLDSSDTNALGTFFVTCYVSGARTVNKEFMVVPSGTYGLIDNTRVQISGLTISPGVSGAIGLVIQGNGTGSGASISGGGTDGAGLSIDSSGSADAVSISGLGTGRAIGLSSNGAEALYAIGAVNKSAVKFQANSGNAAGLEVVGVGSGPGLKAKGGSTGDGMFVDSGGTSGYGQKATGITGGVNFSSPGLDAAGVRAAIGLASANLDTQLGAIDDFIDTEVSAIKTKTDFLPSATAGTAGGLPTVDINNSVKIQSGTGAGQLSVTSGVVASNVTQIDGAATNGNNATLKLKSLDLRSDSASVNALHVQGYAESSSGSGGNAIYAVGGTAFGAGNNGGSGLWVEGGPGFTGANRGHSIRSVASGAGGGSGVSLEGKYGAPPINITVDGYTSIPSLAIGISGNVSGSVGSIASVRPKKNTGLDNFMFPMFDATTKNPKTGLTVTAERAIDGNPFSPCSSGAVELSNGVYRVSLSADDLNGNKVMLRFSATGADDQLIEIITQD